MNCNTCRFFEEKAIFDATPVCHHEKLFQDWSNSSFTPPTYRGDDFGCSLHEPTKARGDATSIRLRLK